MELLKRLKEWLEQWPEHVVLHHQVSSIAQLDIHSPLGKMLSGVESILKKAQQWEEVAPKMYSLHACLEPLSRLVVRWRKIELQSWPELLNAKEVAYKLWMYCLLISSHSGTDSNWFKQLFQDLDKFIQSSTLGENEMRLKLIYGFCLQLNYDLHVEANAFKEKLGNVLYQLYCYYAQHLNNIRIRWWQLLRQPIEKELIEYVKICKWDEQSYYSLKKAAEKLHRKLFKFVKSYEEVLSLPVQSMLDDDKVHSSVHDSLSTRMNILAKKMYKDICFEFEEPEDMTKYSEELCDTFIHRQEKGSQLSWKKKAFNDLLSLLKDEKISYLRSTLPSWMFEMDALFSRKRLRRPLKLTNIASPKAWVSTVVHPITTRF